MTTSLLDSNSVGLCSLIDTTKSTLFTDGCDVLSDSPSDKDFWFSVRVPTPASKDFVEMRSIIERSGVGPASEPRDATPVLVQVPDDWDLLNWNSERQAKMAGNLINRFLRAYEHTYLDVSVPRHRLDGRSVVLLTSYTSCTLRYTPVLLDLNDVLAEYLPTHTDIEQVHLEFLMGDPDSISPSWRILIDGVRHFENGNLREALFCACSAAEIVASPAIDRWLEKLALTGGSDGLRNAAREMGNPVRFELCISAAQSRAFSDLNHAGKTGLLTELRNMNALRNGIVHRGIEPEPSATVSALRAAATFICRMWLASLVRAEPNT